MADTGAIDKGGKRAAIIEAAVQVFSHKGYHNARMEEIAAAAGIGKGTIYEYFSSKLQLFQEVINSSIHVYTASISGDNGVQLNFEQFLQITLQGHIEFCIHHKELTRIVFWDTEIIEEELKEWGNDLRISKREVIRKKIDQAIGHGEIRSLDTDLVILMITGIIGSIWAPITLEGWEVNPPLIAKQITDIIMRGLGAK